MTRNFYRQSFLLLLLALVALPLAAQRARPVLRGAAEGETPQRHLLKTIYEEVIYPPAALKARRTGPYLLKIYVTEDGSDWKAMPLTQQVQMADPMNLVVTTADNTNGAPSDGKMKVAGDRALLEETERMGRYLVDMGFDPADGMTSDSLELVLYYRLEE